MLQAGGSRVRHPVPPASRVQADGGRRGGLARDDLAVRVPLDPLAEGASHQRGRPGRRAVFEHDRDQHTGSHARGPAARRLPDHGGHRAPRGHREGPRPQQGRPRHVLDGPARHRQLRRQGRRGVHRVSRRGPAARGAHDVRAQPAFRGERPPRPRDGDADLQRAGLRDGPLPRPSSRKARPRRRGHRHLAAGHRREPAHPVPAPGGRRAPGRDRPRGARQRRGAAHRLSPGERAPGGHPAGRPRRPVGDARGPLVRRARDPRELVQRDERLAREGAPGAREPHERPRAPGRGPHGGAQERAGGSRAEREARLAGPALGVHRARDQQSSRRHPDLRAPHDAHARERAAGRGDPRGLPQEPRPRPARDRALHRHRPQPPRFRARPPSRPAHRRPDARARRGPLARAAQDAAPGHHGQKRDRGHGLP